MDLFEKCTDSQVVKSASDFMDQGIYPYFRPIATDQDTESQMERALTIFRKVGQNLGLVNL